MYPAGSWNSLPIIGLSDRSWNIGILHYAWLSPRFGCHIVTKLGSSALHCVGGPPSLTEGTTTFNPWEKEEKVKVDVFMKIIDSI